MTGISAKNTNPPPNMNKMAIYLDRNLRGVFVKKLLNKNVVEKTLYCGILNYLRYIILIKKEMCDIFVFFIRKSATQPRKAANNMTN